MGFHMSTEKPPLDPHPLSEYVAWAGNRNREPTLKMMETELSEVVIFSP